MTNRLQYYAFLTTCGLFLFLLLTIGYYHFRYTIYESSFLAPSIKLEPESVDMGDVFVDGGVRQKIVVKNIGWSSLVLERVRPNCSSCLTIRSYPRKPIPPGKRGEIEFSLDNAKDRGRIKTSFIIVSNVRKQKMIIVEVTANIM
jgi:Protein of unknown function (DUF1573).